MFSSRRTAGSLLFLLLAQSPAEESAKLVGEARSLAFDGRYQEALERFRTALAFKPEDAVIQYYVGITLYKLDRLKAARSAFQRCIQLRAEFPEPFLWLGRVEVELSEPDSARSWVEQGLKKFPHHEELLLLSRRLEEH